LAKVVENSVQETRPFTVVLTGGVASGKSTVANIFESLGITIIDTDNIAYELTQPGTTAASLIADEFGPAITFPDGSIDRKKLRDLIFHSDEMRAALESILHPRIFEVANSLIGEVTSPYCILVVPLFVESGQPFEPDRVLVIDVPPEIQLDRLVRRDSIDRSLAQAMLDSQAPRQERLTIADDVILNTSCIDSLDETVKRLHQKYCKLSETKRHSPQSGEL
jgi:dephospho-CoA kinase